MSQRPTDRSLHALLLHRMSLDGRRFEDAGVNVGLRFAAWKGARFGIFSYGGGGTVDVDFVQYRYGSLGLDPSMPDRRSTGG
jgi:hypothetical protein